MPEKAFKGLLAAPAVEGDLERTSAAFARVMAAAREAYTHDVAPGKLSLAAENRGLAHIDDMSRDGRCALLSRANSRGDSSLQLKG